MKPVGSKSSFDDSSTGRVMSQADVAKAMGKSLRSVVRWETSAMEKLKANPDAEWLYWMFEEIRKYGYVGDDFYGGTA